jgi:oligoendopeptidase F
MVEATQERKTGAENIIWDLSIFYDGPDDPAIQSDMEKIADNAATFEANYRDKVATFDGEAMRQAIEDMIEIMDAGGRLSAFASLNYTTDTADPKRGALYQKVSEFSSALGQRMVFFDIEWNELDDNKAQRLINDPVLAEYRHYLEAERRFKPYQLSEPEEKVAMRKNITGRSAWVRFFTQLTSSMRYDFDGEKLTQTQVMSKLHDADREIRRQAADAVTAGLQEQTMQLTYIFNVLAADKAQDDEMRGYDTWIASRNLANKAPEAVVDALVEAVTSRYDLVARHYNLKRILLGLDELTDYDRYAPIPVKDEESTYAWEQARDIVLKAFENFEPRMAQVAGEFFENNWIHAALLPNKRGGAFAHPTVPSAHPFVFVNFDGRARDVSTLAHELGHGIHMYLSGEESNFFALYTPLTTAEMASVFAEMLVFSDLLEKEDDDAVKLSMLANKVEDTFATVYRQTAMNRFEHGMHTARRDEGELTTERFSEIWMETQQAMFGDSVNLRDDYQLWWSYIPHFLGTPGYVYAYAFGELLVLALYNLYKEEGSSFAPKYLDVLAAGDSDYPDEILAKVGVDLNDPAFWHKGLDAIEALVEQEEALARQVYPEKFA